MTGYFVAGIAVIGGIAYALFLTASDETKSAPTPIGITEQGEAEIVIFTDLDGDWNDKEHILWRWKPTVSNGFKGLTYGWGLPNEVRLRHHKVQDRQVMVVTDSKGLAAVVPYPEGEEKVWARVVGGDPHSAELLPNGNVAVAASQGGWVRVYTASQDASSSNYTEFKLAGAHGVLWDPEKELLWALGDYLLVSLKVTGTDDAPLLEQIAGYPLPTPFGHDLQPVYGNANRLWVSTGQRVYQFVKSEQKWDTTYPEYLTVSRPKVKSVGNVEGGPILVTSPKAGCKYEWCTDKVDVILSMSSANEMTFSEKMKEVKGTAIYKARFMNPAYQ